MAMLPTENVDVDSTSKDACVDHVNHNDNSNYWNDVVTEFERKFSSMSSNIYYTSSLSVMHLP